MNITIVGGGKVGLTIARELQIEGHEITLIDTDESVIEHAGNTLDVIGYVGNGASYPILESAGVGQTDLIIAVTATDETNMLCCLLSHKLGVCHAIARVRNPEYAEQLYILKEDLGLSMAVNPDKAAAQEIARILRFPSATHVEMFARGRVELVSFRIPHDNILHGISLRHIRTKLGVTVLICAVERDDHIMIPGGDFVLHRGDTVYLTGAPQEIEHFFRRVKLLSNPVKSVMLAGGGRLSYYLAEELCKQGFHVKMIEKDAARARYLADNLPRVMVLHGDASDHELLNEEGIADTDAFVSLTGLDEGNILSAMYAQKCGVSKVIAKVNNEGLVSLLRGNGPETIISPKAVTSSQILRYVRALDARNSDSNVLSLYRLLDGRVEVSEFCADSTDTDLINIPFRSLPLKKNILVACLVRDHKTIIPGGTDCICAGDSVLVATSGQILGKLKDILEVD